jgi:hypothetical protein
MSNKKIIIFSGPSISKKEASNILKADYRPPIKRNDILDVINESPDIIGIIDGVFHQSPAVSHKEIMKAIGDGITVVGASSMGALRAAELDDLGMIGIGYVYHEYALGNIETDDDLVLTFTADDFTPVSEALINIEYNLSIAVDENIISEKDKKNILEVGRSLYYPDRTYSRILDKSNISKDVKNKLNTFFKTTVDIKKQDAINMLKYIRDNLI